MSAQFVIRYKPNNELVEKGSPREAAFLPFEKFLLWRRPKPYKGQRNAMAYYWFSKTGNHVFCGSRLEMRVLQGLDFDRSVAAVAAQPFELSFEADGKRRRRVPDFFVRGVGGPDRVVLLVAGSSEATIGLPPTVHEAFVLHAREREGYLFRKRRAPASAALMAAVAHMAMDMLDSHSVYDLAGKLEPFVARVCASTPRVSTYFLRRFAFTGELEEAFLESWARLKRTKRPDPNGVRATKDPQFVALTSDDVPQLLWKRVYEDQFAELMYGVRGNHARRFCSMALLRFGGGYTWNSAADLLGLPGRNNDDKGSAAMRLLKDAHTDAMFVARQRELARQIAEDADPVDYGARRRALSTFETIDAIDWGNLCAAAGLSPEVGSRRRYVSAWLWSHLTGGDYRLSPAFRGADCHVYEKYRSFVGRHSFNQLKDSLVPYGNTLLQTMVTSRCSVPGSGAVTATSHSLAGAIEMTDSGAGADVPPTLPPRVRPLRGESFASYLDRLAASRAFT